LYKHGFKSFDNISIYTFLEDKPTVKEKFESMGGYKTVEELRGLVNIENLEAYYDKIVKANTLISLHDKGFNILSNISNFNKMTSQEIYDYFDYHLNNISINTGHDIEIESLEIDDKFIKECNEGETVGINYGKNCRILNYLTLGIPLGEMFMIGGYSGVGKSSFVFENMILAPVESGIKCAVISNEMRSKDFKMLLLIHVLTNELNFWELTRKKLKIGNFTDTQLEMIKKAQKIISEKYNPNIKFVKLFDNDINKVKKIIKKLAKMGYSCILYDTMKSDDLLEESMWQQLLIYSRKLFQIASKENIALITTYQLALHTLNKRYLDAMCLSSGKQVKEIYSEMVYMREIWDDEFNGEKYDINPYQLDKDASGKYSKVKRIITLDRNKKYLIAFLDKTRNDENKKQILYCFNGRYNTWQEIGYCNVVNDHK